MKTNNGLKTFSLKQMHLKKQITNYSQFNIWANDTISNYFKIKPVEILTAEVISSFKNISGTIDHIADSQYFWLDVIRIGIKSESYSPVSEKENIFIRLSESAALLNQVIEDLSEKQLLSQIKTPWIKKDIPVYEVFHHCFNHSTYHRGQVTIMLKQLGYSDIAMTDYYEYLKVVCYK